jgi:hypothetical protein
VPLALLTTESLVVIGLAIILVGLMLGWVYVRWLIRERDRQGKTPAPPRGDGEYN